MKFLTRSRHDTQYYFRRRIPADLRAVLNRTYLIQTLGTPDRRLAIMRARAFAAGSDALFHGLRNMCPIDPRLIHAFKLRATLNEERQVKEIEIEAEAHEAAAVREVLATLVQPTATTPRPAPAPSTSPAPPIMSAPATPASKTISETWEDYKAEKIKGESWVDGEDTAKYDHWPHVRALIDLIGDKAIGDVSADDVARFQTHVLNDEDAGSPRNRDKRLTRAGALFRWAKKKRRITDDFAELFRYSGKIESNGYLKYDAADLKALFESDAYREHRFKTPSEYWLPILGLFTGARLNELCQLTKSDIGEHDGVPTIAILDEDLKRLKTTASRRIVPIHAQLLELGFREFVSTCRSGRIFPDLPENPSRPGDYTKEPSRKFTKYRRQCGVGTDINNGDTRSRKTFHSFRSTLIDAMRKANIPKDHRTRLAGHEYDDTQDKYYDGGDPLTMFDFPTLQAEINRVSFDVTFSNFRKPLRRQKLTSSG